MTTDTYDALAESTAEQITLAQTAIAREVASLEKLIAEARSYEPEAEIASEFCAAFPPTEAGYVTQMRTQVGTGSGALNGVLVMWNARRLQDVMPRLLWLSQRMGRYEIEDYAELGRRTYNFGRFKFCVFFNSYDKNTVCRFVEVGKKEEPIYKLMCGDEEVVS